MALWRPRLRTILLTINLIILILPLGGIAVLRLYESALVRQTESELIVQGAFVGAAYKAALGRMIPDLSPYGNSLLPGQLQDLQSDEPWRPQPATLDLASDVIYPELLDEKPPKKTAASLAVAAGRDLMPIMQNAQMVTLAGMRIVDFQGVVVASTGGLLGRSLASRREIRHALHGEYFSLLRQRTVYNQPALASISRGAGLRVYVAMPIILEQRLVGVVLLRRTPNTIGSALYGKRYPILYGLLALVGVALAVSLFVSFSISRPVRDVIRQTKRAVRGQKGAVAVLERPVTLEIAQLSESVAQMAQYLEQRAEYIQTFASHVSHEFKSPLTSIRGTIELLREHLDTMTPAERDRFLNNLDVDAKRLQRLVARLLELAKADMLALTVADNRPLTPVADVLEKLAGRYLGQGVVVNLVQDESDCLVAMLAETLDSVISNLVDNACQHGGAAESRVTITITTAKIIKTEESGKVGSYTVLSIADDGVGISPANISQIFEPFFTTGRKAERSGIGLSIVRSLIQAHGGTVRLQPATVGTRFILELP